MSPSSCPRASSRPWRRGSSSARCSTPSPPTCKRHTTTLVFVNTRRHGRARRAPARRNGSAMTRWPPTTAASRGSAASARRAAAQGRRVRAARGHGLARAGHRRRRRSSWCARSARRGSIATFLQRVGRSGHSARRHAEGPPLSDDARRARRVRRLLGGGAQRRARRRASAAPRSTSSPSRSSPSARARRWREDDLYELMRQAAPFADLTRADFDRVVDARVRGHRRPGRGRAGALPPPRSHQRRAAGRRGARLAALTSGGAIPETGRLPRACRAGRRLRRNGQRGLGDRDHRRATSSCSAARRGGSGASRPAPCASSMRTARRRRCRSGSARRPARTGELSARGVAPAQRRRRAARRRPTPSEADRSWVDAARRCDDTWRRWSCTYLAAGRTRPRRRADARRTSSSSASSTKRRHAARRARAVRRPHQPRASGWRCASASARPSTSSCRPRRPTTACSCRSGRSTAFRSRTSSSSCPRTRSRSSAPGGALRADVGSPLALEPQPRRSPLLALPGRQDEPPPSSACESDDLMAAVFPQQVACQNENPHGAGRGARSSARHQTMRRLPARGDGPRGAARARRAHRAPARSRSATATCPSRRRSPRDPQRPARTPSSTTRRSRSAAPARSRCDAVCRSRPATSPRSTRMPSRASAARHLRRIRATQTSCTTC